jgi:putative flippase GtrA
VIAAPLLPAALRSPVVERAVRSLGVGALTTTLSLAILAVLTQWTPMRPAVANAIATIAGIGPSFVLNRRLAWRRTGRSDVPREVAPFWTYCLAALVVSTVAVDAADRVASSAGWTSSTRTAVVLIANVTTFAVLWVGQFVLASRIFTAQGSRSEP